MAILVNSKTDKKDSNFWATTWECLNDAEYLYGKEFQLDVCAEPLTAKCRKYYGPPIFYDLAIADEEFRSLISDIEMPRCVGLDALNLKWDNDWFCNPPFDLKGPFIRHAKWQQVNGRSGMMLLPYERQTDWWRRGVGKGCIIYEPDGRYNFLERDGVTKKSGVNFGSALVCFPAMHIVDSITIPFNRGIGAKKAA